MSKSVVAALSTALAARKNCEKSGNVEWLARWADMVDDIVSDLPSGSGIDHGTKLDEDASTPDKLVLIVDFHHMNDGGFYDGWTEHRIIVTPSFSGLNIRITGRDRNGIKEYLGDVFHHALTQSVEDAVSA